MAIDFKKLIEAGVPFGHPTSSWNPKMAPYIWGHKNKVYLINVLETARLLEKAAQFLTSIAAENKTILWIGTKKVARPIITEIAQSLNSPYVTHRWIGGTLTNYAQIRKPIVKLLHYKDVLGKEDDNSHYTKKEIGRLNKEVDRLANNFGGLVNFKWPLGAVVIVDVRKEQSALKEAMSLGVPVVAFVDTNSDPEGINFVIPTNDDGRDAVKIIAQYLAQAVAKGKELAQQKGVAATAAQPGVTKEEITEVFTTTGQVGAEDTEATDANGKAKAKRVDPRKKITK